jgi:hypothetical protein
MFDVASMPSKISGEPFWEIPPPLFKALDAVPEDMAVGSIKVAVQDEVFVNSIRLSGPISSGIISDDCYCSKLMLRRGGEENLNKRDSCCSRRL